MWDNAFSIRQKQFFSVIERFSAVVWWTPSLLINSWLVFDGLKVLLAFWQLMRHCLISLLLKPVCGNVSRQIHPPPACQFPDLNFLQCFKRSNNYLKYIGFLGLNEGVAQWMNKKIILNEIISPVSISLQGQKHDIFAFDFSSINWPLRDAGVKSPMFFSNSIPHL